MHADTRNCTLYIGAVILLLSENRAIINNQMWYCMVLCYKSYIPRFYELGKPVV